MLKDYLSDYLGMTLETKFGYDAEGAYDKIVTLTLEACKATNEAEVPEDKLHKIGIYKLWDQIYKDLMVDWFDVSADNSSYKRSQVLESVKFEMEKARKEAKRYLNPVTISHHPIATTFPK